MKKTTTTLSVPLSLLICTPAIAQRTQENVATNAEDAFGSNVGAESIGIYDPNEVRGFSPIDSGNIRLEGLYMDRQGEFTGRLVAGNRIYVGPSAIGYVLPAPSGIADFRLRKPAADLRLSLAANVDSFGAAFAEADISLPIDGDRLRLGAGSGYYANRSADGRTARVLSMATVGQWQPKDGIEILPLWSNIRTRDNQVAPIIRGNRLTLPARLNRSVFIGQEWAGAERERGNIGLIVRKSSGVLAFSGGIFRSTDETYQGFTLLQDAALPGQLAARSVIADRGRFSGSTSGEFRLTRHFGNGPLRHAATLVFRGRQQQRRYGGSDRRSIGAAAYGTESLAPEPRFSFGAQDRDTVEQYTAGLAYRAVLENIGEISLGVQKIDYRKQVTPVGRQPVSTSDKPTLVSGAVSFDISKRLAIYAGTNSGLEESEIAPEIALNSNEAPPAIRTRQYDGGLRWRPTDGINAVFGFFSIEKPYDGLDSGNIYRRLGRVRHRGVEMSVAGSPLPGLTVLAGGVLLDPRLSGDDVASGQVGKRPVGTPRLRTQLSLDWKPAETSPFSFDMVLTRRGSYYGDTSNIVKVGSYTTLDAGLRYRFKIASQPAQLRLQGFNLNNAYGWDSAGSNGFRPASPRQLVAKLLLDL